MTYKLFQVYQFKVDFLFSAIACLEESDEESDSK